MWRAIREREPPDASQLNLVRYASTPAKEREGALADLRVATIGGAETILEEATVQSLRATLHGPLLCPGDAGYDEARKVWNGMIDRRPALIARCAGVADVIAAVKFARTQQVLVSVRGGGHNARATPYARAV